MRFCGGRQSQRTQCRLGQPDGSFRDGGVDATGISRGIDDVEGKAYQDRGEGGAPRPEGGLSNRGGRSPPRLFRESHGRLSGYELRGRHRDEQGGSKNRGIRLIATGEVSSLNDKECHTQHRNRSASDQIQRKTTRLSLQTHPNPLNHEPNPEKSVNRTFGTHEQQSIGEIPDERLSSHQGFSWERGRVWRTLRSRNSCGSFSGTICILRSYLLAAQINFHSNWMFPR